jgi:23S rRNA-intervening sequence protein
MNDKPHKNLIAWQRSMDLVVGVYEITKRFPKEEIYGLSSQLRRAAVSVPSNPCEITYVLRLRSEEEEGRELLRGLYGQFEETPWWALQWKRSINSLSTTSRNGLL